MTTITDSCNKLMIPLFRDVNSDSATYLKKYYVARLYCVLNVSLAVIAALADGILGLAGSIAVVLTLGKVKKVCQFSFRHSFSFTTLPFGIFMNTLFFMNPTFDQQKLMAPGPTLGILSSELVEAIPKKEAKSWVDKVTRVAFVLPLFITTVVDAIFGALASVFAIATLGNWQECNVFVKRHFLFHSNLIIAYAQIVGQERFVSHYLPTQNA